MILEGKPWHFDGRPYILPIVNENPTQLLLMTGRQSEKSTTTAGRHIAYACKASFESSLYVSPTMTQTSVYSRKKIDNVFETSPLLKANYYTGVRGFSVSEKRLRNNHVMYFRSAYHDADTIRGISSDRTMMDEVQDLDTDAIHVIEECSSHKPLATFMYTGTPKTMTNPIQQMWEKSTQNEWTIKCFCCGTWNRLSIKNIQMDHPGLWCERCGKRIYTQLGVWASYGKSDEMTKGYRFPQIILPEIYINWKKLFHKMRNYSMATLMNEVFGLSYDNGSKPITQAEVFAACHIDRPMEETSAMGHKGYEMYAGIDWASGNGNCFTVMYLGYYDHVNDKLKITYCKKYVGREADPEIMLPDMVKILNANSVRYVAADYGFGFGCNGRLALMLGNNVKFHMFFHGPSKNFVAWNPKSKFYSLGKTVVLTEVFELVKRRFIEFPCWNDYQIHAKDLLNEDTEYNDRSGLMRYDHLPVNPDDGLHALVFLYCFFAIKSKRKALSNYDPSVEP
jgi:hypothetical protein